MNKFLIIGLIGLGGALGSIARYLIGVLITHLKWVSSGFPYATFLVNILGCLLIGLFFGIGKSNNWLDHYTGLFLITGFCGGFTTFSTFSFESLELLQKAKYMYFALYSIGSFAIGLLAVIAGLYIAKQLFH